MSQKKLQMPVIALLIVTILNVSISVGAQAPAPAPAPAPVPVLEQAKKLFETKKYSEAAALLGQEIKKGNPSAEMLRLAMESEVLAGNIISANQLAASLLKLTDNKDFSLVFRAAEIAALAGDSKIALSRYHSYCQNAKTKDENFIKAINYLAAHGSYIDAYKNAVEILDSETYWRPCLDFAGKLINEREMEQFANLSAFILKSYQGSPHVVADLLAQICNSQAKFNSEEKLRILDVLVSNKLPEKLATDQLAWYMREALKDNKNGQKKVEFGGKFQHTNKRTLPADLWLTPYAQQLASMNNVSKQIDTAQSFFADYEALYKDSPNRNDYLDFCNCVLSNPKAFIAGSDIVSVERLSGMLDTLDKKYDGQFRNCDWSNGIMSPAINVYLKDDKKKQAAFLRANMKRLNSAWFLYLLNVDNTNVKADLDAYLKSFSGFALERAESEIVYAFRIAQRKDKFISAAKAQMQYNPAFDKGFLMNEMLGSKFLSEKEAVALVSDVYEKAGYSNNLAEFVKMMGQQKTVADTAEYKALAAAVNQKKDGSDPGFSALAKLYMLPPTPANAAQIEKICDGFLSSYKGNLPASMELAANAQDYLACLIWQYNSRLTESAATGRWAERWAPRAKQLGEIWNSMVFSLWDRSAGKAKSLWAIAPYYIQLIATGQKDPRSGECLFRLSREGAKEDKSIFESIYGIQPSSSLEYVKNQANQWSPAFYFKQITTLVGNEKNIFPLSEISGLIDHLSHGPQNKEPIPSELSLALLKALSASEKQDKVLYYHYEAMLYNLAQRAKNQAAIGPFMELYSKLIAARTKYQQMQTINELFSRVSVDRILGGKFLATELKKLLAAWPEKEWKEIAVSYKLLDFLQDFAKDEKMDAAQRGDCKKMYNQLASAILAENASISQKESQLYGPFLTPFLVEAIKKKDMMLTLQGMQIMSEVLNGEDNAGRGVDSVKKIVEAIEKEEGSKQALYALLSGLTKGKTPFNDAMKKDYVSYIAKLSREIPGIVPVNKNDPAYSLFMASQLLDEGNSQQAWVLLRPNQALLAKRWKELDFNFVLWGIDQLRRQKMYKEALETSMTIWLDEASLPAEDAGKLGLLKGDIYRDMKNFPSARLEYEALNTNPRYVKTEAGRMAKFRMADLLIAMQDYTNARLMLERLVDSDSLPEQAEAYYLLAKIEAEQKEYQSANDYLKMVFKRVYGHVAARLLEGELRLATRNIKDSEIQIGNKKLQTIAIPGSELELKIQDNNLSIARGGKSIPVTVATTDGKDKETIELVPSADDTTLFSGKIQTALGKATPGNLLLELNGTDEVVYMISPEFQQSNGLDYPPKKLEVKYGAKLYASSKKILPQKEQEQLMVNEGLMGSSSSTTRRSMFRDNKVLRPGSPLYLQVIDYDMDLTDNKDKVFVDASTSSGDEIKNLELTETTEHSGIFEAVVPTSVPFPMAIASDAKEDVDVNSVINSSKKGFWISLPDGKKPKWLEVDTMNSSNFKEISIELPNPKSITQLKLFASLDKNEDTICVYPESAKQSDAGGMTARVLPGSEHTKDAIESRFKRAQPTQYWFDSPVFERALTAQQGQDGWFLVEMSGAFWLEQNMELEFKFLQPIKKGQDQYAYLIIDDNVIMGGQINESTVNSTRALFLSKGVHSIKILLRDNSKDSQMIIGYEQKDGTYQPLPSAWFDIEKNASLADYLKPKGKIDKTPNGFKVTLNEPTRYRKIKWVFQDFTGNQLEVSKITAKDEKGNAILPVAQDLSTGKTNKVLEIAADDRIEVKYSDEKRLDDNKSVLSEKLSSSFNNGSIQFSYEEVVMTQDGNSRSELVKAKRVQKNDVIMVTVTDYDEDLTEGNDVIKAEISTSSGEKLAVDLLENTERPGEFSQIIKFGDKTGGDTVKFHSGDLIKASYLDKENNSPGIPVQRSCSVMAIEGSKPDVNVFKTMVSQIEDKSVEARNKVRNLQDKGDKRENIKIFKDQIDAELVRTPEGKSVEVSSKAPLLFEVAYPEMAKHLNSVAEALVTAQSEIDAAKAAGRKPESLKVPIVLKNISSLAKSKGYSVSLSNKKVLSEEELLDVGIFAGIVRLQLGSPGDEINDVVADNESFNLLNTENRADNSAFKVPTALVSGSDKLHIVINDKTGKTLTERLVELKSNGELELMDKNFLTPMDSIHIGQDFYLRIYDPDQDITNDRDEVVVTAASGIGDTLKMKLSETLPHSGVFTGILKPELHKAKVDGKDNPVKKDDEVLETNFGDEITFTYIDNNPLTSKDPMKVAKAGRIVVGADGELASFTKKFKDPEMAVKTNFLMAEALFEMAKSHRAMQKDDIAKDEISRGKRILEEALRDYPDTSLKAQGEFLLANLAQNLENYQEAIGRYAIVISRWPDSEYAVKSQFQKAQCLEKMNQGPQACEEYVKLTYLYPDSPLVADAKIRLGNFYYKNKKYKSASVIFKKFSDNHPGHVLAAKSLFLAAQCELKYLQETAETAKANNLKYEADYTDAIKILQELVDKYQDDKDLRPEAMYWLGDSYFKQGKNGQAKSYQMFKKLTWDYPESKWAKIARGRLADSTWDQ